MWLRWLPWRFIIRRAAASRGFIDPLAILASLHRFAEPSEVAEPIELLRAGLVMHARGLINTRAIQHNLDWVWPYWVERQFNPSDPSFIPRAFSITHINLTHRNWTAVGLPGLEEMPLVDPRGLVTPFLDGWSLDCWLRTPSGCELLPSRLKSVSQMLDIDGTLAVVTEATEGELSLKLRSEVLIEDDQPVCRVTAFGSGPLGTEIICSVRPYNPEGVSLIHSIKSDSQGQKLEIDQAKGRTDRLSFSRRPSRLLMSDYRRGDVLGHVRRSDTKEDQDKAICQVGMATAATVFKSEDGAIEMSVPLPRPDQAIRRWDEIGSNIAKLSLPNRRIVEIYDRALRTMLLLSPGDIYAGPFTYKRFWFRDAALILQAMIAAGFEAEAERAIARFWSRQTSSGYFKSQEGEWDSNGEVLWILERYYTATGRRPVEAEISAIEKAGRWIIDKLTPSNGDAEHRGLLPAGFSAEHLGPNDFYFWDDFWSLAGLRAAMAILSSEGRQAEAARLEQGTAKLASAIDRAVSRSAAKNGYAAIPASVYRRMDAGAIGSLCADYPLQLYPPDDLKISNTAEFLFNETCLDDGFFQDMIHSGINPYLTLHIAQVLLRRGDMRCMQLFDGIERLASPTGQWPEAVHPITRGGCMGDGQHGWACAEWFMFLRNCFVREEGAKLVLVSGVTSNWISTGEQISFGPTKTRFGSITVAVQANEGEAEIWIDGYWHTSAPDIEVRLPGFATLYLPQSAESAYKVRICRQTDSSAEASRGRKTATIDPV
jgi:hypothetical protein